MEQKTETAIIIIIVVVVAIAAVLADDCGFWHEIERLTRDDNQAAGGGVADSAGCNLQLAPAARHARSMYVC